MKKSQIIYIRDETTYMEIHFWSGSEGIFKRILLIILIIFLVGGFIMPIIYFILEYSQEKFVDWFLSRLFWTPILLYLLYKINDMLNHPFVVILDAEHDVVKCSGELFRKKLNTRPLSRVKHCFIYHQGNYRLSEPLKKPEERDKFNLVFEHENKTINSVRGIDGAMNREVVELYDRMGAFFKRNGYKLGKNANNDD